VRILKLILLGLLLPTFLLFALFTWLGASLFRLPRLRIASQLMRSFTIILRILLNVKINLEGPTDCLDTRGQLIVSNHLGYLDGIVLGSIFPVIFVTKRQVKRWPVIGQLLMLLGGIFVDREDKKDILRVVDRISKTLRREANVLLFPEGTSTNGEKLLPFQSTFFAAPLICRAVVVPVTLTYRLVDQQPVSAANRDRVYWYGNMSFAPHLWNLLSTNRIEVSVKIHSSIETSELENDSQGRKELSQACYDVIARGVSSETGKKLEMPEFLSGRVRRQAY
jgi:lyso-ornithine lipid O-acyltransferase